ncbi:MAG: Sua5/YciO/YrdC/YwlC family protein, partial [Patescibacteria group bacterium]
GSSSIDESAITGESIPVEKTAGHIVIGATINKHGSFIFKATKYVPNELIPNKKTVAIRVPDNQVCLKLVEMLGNPIVTTSVNITDEPHFSDPLQIEREFGEQVDLIIDAGILKNEPSSVVDLSGDAPVVIREGKGDVSFL